MLLAWQPRTISSPCVAMTVPGETTKDKNSPSRWEGMVSKDSRRNAYNATLKSWIFHPVILSVINSHSHFSLGSCSSWSLPAVTILRVYYPFLMQLLPAWLIQWILEFFPATNTKNPFSDNKVFPTLKERKTFSSVQCFSLTNSPALPTPPVSQLSSMCGLHSSVFNLST